MAVSNLVMSPGRGPSAVFTTSKQPYRQLATQTSRRRPRDQHRMV